MLRLLKTSAAYIVAALLITTVSIGLVNTYLGDLSPVRAWLKSAKAQLPNKVQLPDLPSFSSLGREGSASAIDAGAEVSGMFISDASVSGEHAAAGVGVCTMPRAAREDYGTDVQIYSWVNEDGVRSFGDEAPEHHTSRERKYQRGHSEFFADIHSEGVDIPGDVRGRIMAGAKRIYEQWGTWLGYSNIVRSHINVRIIGDRKTYRNTWGAARDEPPAGFYRLDSNEAVLFYDPSKMSDERLVGLAFHEISHLILAWHIGMAPPWYNEGVAEYFETMTVKSQSATFARNRHSLKVAGREGPVPLQQLMAYTPSNWYEGNIAARYATAGLLITFLQTSDTGRDFLRSLALTYHAERCSAGKAAETPSFSAYPGGFLSMERDWNAWLRSAAQR